MEKCDICGNFTLPVIEERGDILICIILFLFFIIPGVLYLYFGFYKIKKCGYCGKIFKKERVNIFKKRKFQNIYKY